MDKKTTAEAPENEGHEEAMELVERGGASVLSDEDEAGGRFQVIAAIMGGEFIVTTWHQDAANDWRSTGCVVLKRDAATKLVELLHSSGSATPLAAVK